MSGHSFAVSAAKQLTFRHDFEKKDVPVSTTCIICHSMMLGIGKQAYQCRRCCQAVHKKCLRKGLEDLCKGAEETEKTGPVLSEEDVRQLQQRVFALQKTLFQQQVELDSQMKEFEKEKEKFVRCKSLIAKLLPPGLEPYFDYMDDIVNAQKIARSWLNHRRNVHFQNKRKDFRESMELSRSRWYELVQEYRHSIAAEESRKRYQSFREILTTERQYNAALSALRTYFVIPIREEAVYSKRPIISSEEMEELLILESLDTISVLQSEILTKLEECFRSNKFDRFAEVFLPFCSRFENPYLQYLIEYDKSSALFQHLQNTNREFCVLLKRCETSVPGATLGTSLNLQSYLVQPCQRLPRYQMLFKALLEQSPPNHADIDGMKKVSEEITKVVIAVNNNKAEYEDRQTLLSLEQSIQDFGLVKPGRRVVKEGPIVAFDLPPLEGAEKSEREKCHAVLCNDLLLLSSKNKKAKGKMYIPRLVVPTAAISCATEVPREAQEKWAQDHDGENTGFRMTLADSTIHRLLPPDLQEMKKWVRALCSLKSGVEKKDKNETTPTKARVVGSLSEDVLKKDCSLLVLANRLEGLSCPASPQRETGLNAVALYALAMKEGVERKHLQFKPGNLIVDIEVREGEWWVGRVFGSQNSPKGPFPRSYVAVLPSYIPKPSPPQGPPSASFSSIPSPRSLPQGPPPAASFGSVPSPRALPGNPPQGPPSGASFSSIPGVLPGASPPTSSSFAMGPPQVPPSRRPRSSTSGAAAAAGQPPAPFPRGGLPNRPAAPPPRSSPSQGPGGAAGGSFWGLSWDEGRGGVGGGGRGGGGNRLAALSKMKSGAEATRGNGVSLQLVFKGQSYSCAPADPSNQIIWNEKFKCTGVSPRCQLVTILFNNETNAVLDYNFVPIGNLHYGASNKGVTVAFKIVGGTLHLDIDVLMKGKVAEVEETQHAFVSVVQSLHSYCPICLKMIAALSFAPVCSLCGQAVHASCKPNIKSFCVPLLKIQTDSALSSSGSLANSSSITSLSSISEVSSPGRGVARPQSVLGSKIETFADLMKAMSEAADQPLFSPLISPGLLKRLGNAMAEFEGAFSGGLKGEDPKSMSRAVKLPKKMDMNDWIAANMIQSYRLINQMYLLISTECTEKKCPVMNGSPTIEYKWADGKKVVKAIDVSAREYVRYLNEWIEVQFRDPQIFPGSGKFSKKALFSAIKVMMKKLLRVVGHVYYKHFSSARTRAGAAFKMGFSYVYYFQQEYKLLDKKADATTLGPIDDLIRQV